MSLKSVRAAIAAFFVAGLISFSLVSAIMENNHTIKLHRSADRNDTYVANRESEKGFWQIFFHDPTAFFTGALALFTVVLAFATIGLILVTRRGIREQADLTRDAISQAERSALAAERALEGADAPFISVIPEINAVKQQMIGGRIVVQFMSGDRIIRYSLINYGKSPAMVLEMYQGTIVSPRIPQPTNFPPPQSNIFKVEIVGPDKETPKYYIDAIDTIRAGGDAKLSWADDKAITGDILWIVFQIRYRDALGAQFVSCHTFAFNPHLAEFYAEGGISHNYRRKLTKDELAAVEGRDS